MLGRLREPTVKTQESNHELPNNSTTEGDDGTSRSRIQESRHFLKRLIELVLLFFNIINALQSLLVRGQDLLPVRLRGKSVEAVFQATSKCIMQVGIHWLVDMQGTIGHEMTEILKCFASYLRCFRIVVARF